MCSINKRNHRKHDREKHGKIQEYFKRIFSGAGKHKGEEEIEIPFTIINSKYSTIYNKHTRFIFIIYFVVIRFCCNYQYFSLHAYTLPIGIPMHL